MKIKILITIILLSTNTISKSTAIKWTKVDEKYKKENLTKLSLRNDYAGHKRWSKMTKIAIKYEDKEILKNMFSIKATSSFRHTEWVTDLFIIFKERPNFFISTGYEYFKKNMDCLVNLYSVRQEIIPAQEMKNLYKVQKKGLNKLGKTFFKKWFLDAKNPKAKTLKTKSCLGL